MLVYEIFRKFYARLNELLEFNFVNLCRCW